MTVHASGEIATVWQMGAALVRIALGAASFAGDHLFLLTALTTLIYGAAAAAVRQLANRGSDGRVRFRLTPGATFDPDEEQIWRQATLLARAARSGKWWVPARARTVRVVLRADGTRPLDYFLEGPRASAQLLAATPFKQVTASKTEQKRDKRREFTVRAEFTLSGPLTRTLREVPLQPDPLQPLVDAVATLRSDLGDLAEVCLDLQPVGRWQLKLRRWRLLAEARERARRTARRESRAAHADSADAEGSLRYQLSALLNGDTSGNRMVLPAQPRPIDRAKTLGKLHESAGLLRIQLLVRCSSDHKGRAEARLAHLAAAFDVFAGPAHLGRRGLSFGPWRIGSDHRIYRRAFDERWQRAQIHGPVSWVRPQEIAGLLKPPTVHCQLPILASDLPRYSPGAPALMPQGWHTGPDGTERLVASTLTETKFSVRVGKSGYGKTEQALVQFAALAHGNPEVGGLFVDPHGDGLAALAPYLAHPEIMARLLCLDLTGRHGDQARMGTWNPLGLEHGQDPGSVAQDVVDTFTKVLGWTDASHPRAMTILDKAVEALVAVNNAAVRAGRPDQQATLFQIPTLLTKPAWRNAVVAGLEPKAAEWWRTIYPTFSDDATSPVLNPLERLFKNRVTRALLGSPTSSYNIREAMDTGKLVWISPSASGPTDRLLISLLFRDLFRATLARRDMPAQHRRDFHAFIDELISVSAMAAEILAEMTEELRKFGLRLHAMTQLLQRVPTAVRTSLLQNASVLSSSAGSVEATGLVATEWHGRIDPVGISHLPRFHHYVSLTHHGRMIGPLLIRNPHLEEVFGNLARPNKTQLLRLTADTNLSARPVAYLCGVAAEHDAAVAEFLRPARNTPRPAGQQPPAEGPIDPEFS
ncbi:ATP/GTP-binding protein [Streptomyces lunaelactis]|uniref:ATP/GTP-binding protein n=1 Tax=Streptomyces lunaelactis TaxID=1535768 RepID=A0A2R4SVN5_9ACTN|nr:ATP/GTP-binding protein [Streptomyces lunaelactis]AVZ70924.1 ATP/GTP-binding protein [Streptomyces lunaelactis]NUK25180.1 ATP/GTP-binding protein [Streptomyces lunaelactis]